MKSSNKKYEMSRLELFLALLSERKRLTFNQIVSMKKWLWLGIPIFLFFFILYHVKDVIVTGMIVDFEDKMITLLMSLLFLIFSVFLSVMAILNFFEDSKDSYLVIKEDDSDYEPLENEDDY